MSTKLTKEYLLNRFPNNIKFAFKSNFINKQQSIINKNSTKPIDLVIVTSNRTEFHKENYRLNKYDYPLIVKLLSLKIVNFAQSRGARIHYNTYSIPSSDLNTKDKSSNDKYIDSTKSLEERVRYSIVDWNDFENDLLNWKYLTVSSFMQKPFEVIYTEKESDELLITQLQEANLKTTVAYIMLILLNTNIENSKTIIKERDFYKKILQIPIMKDSFISKFLNLDQNRINVIEVINSQDFIYEMRSMYKDIINELSEYGVEYRIDNEEIVIENNLLLREALIDELPSYLISRVNLSVDEKESKPNESSEVKETYGKTKVNFLSKIRKSKKIGNLKEKYDSKIRKGFASNFNIYKQNLLKDMIKRIMKKHKNSRVFFILMSKYFFIGFWIVKLLVKVGIVYYFYRKSGAVHIPFIYKSNKDREK